MARWLPWIGLAVRLVAAGIWLFAGVAKLADLEGFRSQVHAYQMLPGALLSPFAYGLPLLEVAIGAYLLVGAMVRQAAILACVLMAIFLIAEGQAWARGLSIDCGCFGTTVETTIGAGTILRDLALGVPSVLMAWRPARKWSVDASFLGRQDAFAVTGSAAG
jgi:uncharacterized membrane protein YphA (DoxX/SURF4 family)